MIVHDLRANDRDLQVWLGAVREIAAAGLDRERERIAAIFAAKACPALVGITASISSIHAPGFGAPVIVHGLPVVPESDERCQDKVNDLLLVGVVEAAGMSVFSYRQQVAGRLVQDVRPLPGRELTNSHAGRVPLGWHTDEAAFRPQYRAEGIALLCVNNAAGATTSYRDVGD